MRILVAVVVFTLSVFSSPQHSCAKVTPAAYGLQLNNVPEQVNMASKTKMDSLLATNKMLVKRQVISGITAERIMVDKTTDFYLLILLCLLLGIVVYSDPRYFANMWRVFTTPGQSTAAKEQMEISVVSNALMNLFFVAVGGAYIFYLAGGNKMLASVGNSRGYFIAVLTAGVAVIYLTKYTVLQLTGWAFKIKQITEYYIFNVFLMNKIMAIALLPLVIILAFAEKGLHYPVILLSTAVIGILFLNRYLRSWRAFGSFFQYSKFHFFTYLCASEILPLAVLMKLLVRGFGL